MITVQSWSYFAAAVAVLFSAHVVRSYRHSLLFPVGSIEKRFDLLLALALAYAGNLVLPFRAGDLLRIGLISIRYHIRLPYVMATVVSERTSDLLVVAAILAAGAAVLGNVPLNWIFAVGGAGLLAVATAFAITYSGKARRLIWQGAAIFNDRLKFGILDFVWTYATMVSGSELLKPRYLASSGVMWALYLLSYSFFGSAVHTSFSEVGLVLLGMPQRSVLEQVLDQRVSGSSLALLAFTSAPIISVIVYGAMKRSRQVMRSLELLRQFGFGVMGTAMPDTGGRFRDPQDYSVFLQSMFYGAEEIVNKFGTVGLQDAIVHRILPGGSDAMTALIEVGNELRVRKCASGTAAVKLLDQKRWLDKYQQELPLANVIEQLGAESFYSYDMPYSLFARDFYEVIHTLPLATSFLILDDVIARTSAFHEKFETAPATDEVIDAYLREKVGANARTALNFAIALLPERSYTINGERYHLDEWDRFFDQGWLFAQIHSRETAVIHGDLTVENIIVKLDGISNWYIIDPNPQNIFNTPLIDWAKLMQSVNLGYEGLNRGSQSSLRGSDIEVLFTRSSMYTDLHRFLNDKLERLLGPDRMREVAFHELVNYLRLTPYKIRQHPQKATTFFACVSVLLRRYVSAASKPGARAPAEALGAVW